MGEEALEIEVKDLRRSFGSLHVLKGVSLVIRQHDVVALVGPSGSGKSTLLRCLNLLEFPDQGEIQWQGKHVPYHQMSALELSRHRRRMGMVFQHFNLFPHLRAVENVMEGLVQVIGLSKDDAYDQAMSLMKDVGIEDKARSWPSQLSGGQKQRVAIARALAMKPEVLLLDEVTSALDIEVISEINELLRTIADRGMTMVVVTHDLSFAGQIADYVHFMDSGRIVESGLPDQIISSPQKKRTRSFMAKVYAEA